MITNPVLKVSHFHDILLPPASLKTQGTQRKNDAAIVRIYRISAKEGFSAVVDYAGSPMTKEMR